MQLRQPPTRLPVSPANTTYNLMLSLNSPLSRLVDKPPPPSHLEHLLHTYTMPFFKSTKPKALHQALERKYISRPYLMSSDKENQFAVYIPIYNRHRPIRLADARENPEIMYRGHNHLHAPRPTLADLIVDEEGALELTTDGNIKHRFGTELIPVGLAAKSLSTKYRHEGFEMEDAGGPAQHWARYRG